MGVVMALLALAMLLSSQVPILPSGLRSFFSPLCLGLVIGLMGFIRAYSGDWNRHKPWGREFLSKSFFMAYLLCILILVVQPMRDLFKGPH
jgi:hypothetical protein